MRLLLATLPLLLPTAVSAAASPVAPGRCAQQDEGGEDAPPERLEVGQRLPAFILEGLSGTPASGCDEFHGRTLLLCFFAFWSPECAAPVAHLNALQERHGVAGLTVLGITREELAKSAPWIEEHGLQIAWGKDPGGALSDLFQVVDLPYFALVDPFGEVRWRGPAKRLGEMDLERALEGALETPIWAWPDEARVLLPLLLEGRYADALAAARALPAEDGVHALALLGQLVLARLSTLEKRVARGETHSAYLLCRRLASELAGTPEGEALVARLEALEQDPGVKRQLALVERLVQCEQRIRNLAMARAQRAELQRILAEQPGPEVAERARRRLAIVDDILTRADKNKARTSGPPR